MAQSSELFACFPPYVHDQVNFLILLLSDRLISGLSGVGMSRSDL